MEKKHIMTFNANIIKGLKEDAGCGECQSSCQSACKTSCTVANQSCLKDQEKVVTDYFFQTAGKRMFRAGISYKKAEAETGR